MPLATPTATEVKAVIPVTLADAAVDAFIADAVLVAEGCPAVAGYSEAKQKAIIKYLTAHLIACTPHGIGMTNVTQKSLGDASESFGSAPVGTDLRSTSFGNQAIMLDPSGCLERVGKQRAFMEIV